MTRPAVGTAIGRGVALAAAAALLFGLAAPAVKAASAGSGALASGAVIYAGAAAVAWLVGRGRARRDVPLRANAWPRLIAVALIGGAFAPALLVLGLRRTDAAAGALLLTLEAPFTIILAGLIHSEQVGPRALSAAAVILAAGALLAGGRLSAGTAPLGAALVAASALAWAGDNVLSRPLANLDPLQVVAYKGTVGGGVAAALALLLGEAWPGVPGTLTLLAVGGLGFGLSLWLYLLAQRRIGAARTVSVFGAAPFIGALVSVAAGMSRPSWALLVAAVLVAIGLWLHGGERHDHRHAHPALVHEHLHSHDDGHHDHPHDPMPAGPHAHPHRHGKLEHSHEHAEDIHHGGHHRPA